MYTFAIPAKSEQIEDLLSGLLLPEAPVVVTEPIVLIMVTNLVSYSGSLLAVEA